MGQRPGWEREFVHTARVSVHAAEDVEIPLVNSACKSASWSYCDTLGGDELLNEVGIHQQDRQLSVGPALFIVVHGLIGKSLYLQDDLAQLLRTNTFPRGLSFGQPSDGLAAVRPKSRPTLFPWALICRLSLVLSVI